MSEEKLDQGEDVEAHGLGGRSPLRNDELDVEAHGGGGRGPTKNDDDFEAHGGGGRGPTRADDDDDEGDDVEAHRRRST